MGFKGTKHEIKFDKEQSSHKTASIASKSGTASPRTRVSTSAPTSGYTVRAYFRAE